LKKERHFFKLENMVRIMPKTLPGKWSLVLIVAMPVFFFVGFSSKDWLYSSVSSGSTILQDINRRPMLALTMLSGMAAGVSAFFVGIAAIMKQKERALLVWISTLLGAFVILFIFGEIIFPH
jgi:hypothetical protein